MHDLNKVLINTGAAYSVFKSMVGEKSGINIYAGKPGPLTVGNPLQIII